MHSDAVLLPMAFGELPGARYDADTGALIASFTATGDAKGSGKQRGLTQCCFS